MIIYSKFKAPKLDWYQI